MTNDELRWANWMCLAQQGNEQAYHSLLTEISQVIAAYLTKHFGIDELVDDCVQECLITIHQARHTYDPNRLFRPWLFALVRHKAIDLLRKQNHYHSLLKQQHSLQQHSDQYMDNSQYELIADTLFAQLDPVHRDALIMTKLIGMSSAEAAEKLDISVSALKVRVHRAIKTVRKILENERYG